MSLLFFSYYYFFNNYKLSDGVFSCINYFTNFFNLRKIGKPISTAWNYQKDLQNKCIKILTRAPRFKRNKSFNKTKFFLKKRLSYFADKIYQTEKINFN